MPRKIGWPSTYACGKLSKPLDLEERMEDRIPRIHVDELDPRQYLAHVLGERFPAAALQTAPTRRLEVVDEQKSALFEIRAQPGSLLVGHRPPPDFNDVGDRVLEQLGIVQRHG